MFNKRKPEKLSNLELIELSAKKLKHHAHGEKKQTLKQIIKKVQEEKRMVSFGGYSDDDDDDDDDVIEGEPYFKPNLNQHNYENQNRKFSINGQPISIQPFDTDTDSGFGDSTGILVRHS